MLDKSVGDIHGGHYRSLRPGDAELTADGSRGGFFDFAVAGDGGATAVGGIAVDAVVRALAVEVAAEFLYVGNEVASFHDTPVSIESVSWMASPGISRSAFSR